LGDEAVESPEQEIIEASADLDVGAGLEGSSPAFEPSLGDHAYPAEQQAAPQHEEAGSEEELPPILAAGHPPLVDVEPAPAPVLREASAPPPEAPGATEAAASEPAPRRRSTIREPVILQGESNGAAAPETAPTEHPSAEAAPEENAAPFAEPSVEPAESAAQGEPVGARRTGWWARRIMGGNKG